jgi:hypothetical protein
MKRLFLTALAFAAAQPANAAENYADKKDRDAILAMAKALPIRKCELNDGTKDWYFVVGVPVGSLPVYRCTAEGKAASATFTQSPDAAESKEFVELCTFSGSMKKQKCQIAPADRPARRTADLAIYGVTERQFEEFECEYTSVGTMPIEVCPPPRAKQIGQVKRN